MTVRIGFAAPTGQERYFHLFKLQMIRPGVGREIVVGYHRYSREQLIAWRTDGLRVRLWAMGVISFAPDVSPALVDDVFESITVRGWLRNRPARPTAEPLRS